MMPSRGGHFSNLSLKVRTYPDLVAKSIDIPKSVATDQPQLSPMFYSSYPISILHFLRPLDKSQRLYSTKLIHIAVIDLKVELELAQVPHIFKRAIL